MLSTSAEVGNSQQSLHLDNKVNIEMEKFSLRE